MLLATLDQIADLCIQWKKHDEKNTELNSCVIKQWPWSKKYEHEGLLGVATEAVYVRRPSCLLRVIVLTYWPAINTSLTTWSMAIIGSMPDGTRTMPTVFGSIG